ncbi:hypothetical protein ISS05_05415 [Candidatus Woesearchaeota archaeon]|nr:hypothetical protein [Candidatus Woesearchaeota archaeon]
MKKINKKSQVTVFIVVGLLILVTISLVFYLNSRAGKSDSEREALEEQPEFAGQTQLKDYVDGCIRPAVLQGLEIMRLQGGYVNIPSHVKTMPVKDKENKQVKIVDDSKRVVVDVNGPGNEVPYWILKDTLAVPSLSFMENEIEMYVTEEVGKCVNDFKPFREQNYEVVYGDITTNVDMEKAVIVSINLPITLEKDNLKIDEENFVYTVPVNMRLISKMASDLTLYEVAYNYLEEHTQSLISLYSRIDEKRLPPIGQSETNFDCNQVNWEKKDVEEMLKAVFKKNFPHLKVKGTGYDLPLTQDPMSKGVYESFIHTLFDGNYSKVKVNFSYRSEWEFIDYDINPSQGESLIPHTSRQSKIPMVGLICVMDYSFKYTLDSPVLVEVYEEDSAIIDPTANVYFENRGFKFQFLLDSYICGNQKRECTGKNVVEIDEASIAEELGVTLLPESYFCDAKQRLSGEVTVNTYDSLNGGKLPGVDVFYYCGSYQNDCFMGRTDSNGVLKSKFPYCVNGKIYFIKKDYSEQKKELTINDGNDKSLDYKISPLKDFSVDIKKISLKNYVRNYHETGSLDIQNSLLDFESSEKAIIIANGHNMISYMHPSENSSVKVTEGDYSLDASLFGDINIVETDYGKGGVAKGFKGIYSLGMISMPWSVKQEELAKSKITFYTFAEYISSELNPGTWRDIDDNILTDDGISAELLYRCNKISTDPVICNYASCQFIAVDGINTIDFNDNAYNCEKAYQVEIKKEQYNNYVKPKFS